MKIDKKYDWDWEMESKKYGLYRCFNKWMNWTERDKD